MLKSDSPRPRDVPQSVLLRDSLVGMLETLLDGPARIVIVEGQEGAGKTTLLTQFRDAHASSCIGLFISGASRWAYSPAQVQIDLCAQLFQVINGSPLPDDVVVDQTLLQSLLNDLMRTVRFKRRPFYFILDGLDEVPTTDEVTAQQIVDLLPFGVEPLRFLISGDLATLPLSKAARRSAKSAQVPPFSFEETGRFLRDVAGIDHDGLVELHRSTRGVPGTLAVVRRILMNASDVTAAIARLPEELPELFAIEWRTISESDDVQHSALSLLSLDGRPFSTSDLSAILAQEADVVERSLARLPFLHRTDEDQWRFASEGYRRYASQQLMHLRQQANDLLIEYHQQNPDSDDALANLPTFFANAQKLAELVEYLSPERVARLFQRAPSLRIVQQRADQGMEAARRLGKDSDVIRFALQKCAIEQIAQSEITLAEMRARTAIGDYANALAMADAPSRLEARFRLLVHLARARKEMNLLPDPVLDERIRGLFDALDPASLGAQVSDTASDLFFSAPDLAIELVSRQAGSPDDANAMDWAFARLALQAHLAKGDANSPTRVRAIADRIKNPAAQRLSREAAFVMGGLTAAQAIAEAQRLELVGDRLYVLQHWMLGNRARDDALQVLDFGLRTALQATDYTANAKVYRQLALCLPHIEELQAASYYIGLIDGQKAVLQGLGPFEEFVRLQLIMARCEWRYDRELSARRLESLCFELCAVRDSSTRGSGLAHLTAALARLTQKTADEKISPISAIAEEELGRTVDQLLTGSAEQVETIRGILGALSLRHPQLALNVVSLINTERRRDEAYQEVLDVILGGSLLEVEFEMVEWAFDRIVDARVRDEALYRLVRGLNRRSFHDDTPRRFVAICERAQNVRDLFGRALCLSAAVHVLGKSSATECVAFVRKATQGALHAWSALDDDWRKLEVAYTIVADIAASDPDAAKELIERANELKAQLSVMDAEAATAARLGVRLAMRAFAAVAAKQLESPDDVERLLAIARTVGAIEEQADLLGELALRVYLVGRKNLCAEIVQGHLVPLIQSMPQEDRGRREDLIVRMAPALYAGATNTALAALAELSDVMRDEALERVVMCVMRKTSPDDPYDAGPRVGFDINFEDANTILALLRLMTNDALIYGVLCALVDSATSVAYGANFKRPQKAELLRQLADIRDTKFPNQRFIRHAGYSIVTDAQLNRLRERESEVRPSELAERAERIDNLADRAYVLAIIAACCRSGKDRQEYARRAKEVADRIDVLGDRLERFEAICGVLSHTEPQWAKELLREAMELSIRGEGESVVERRQSLVGLANRIDPEFAASLASSLDDDPGRRRIERDLRLYKLRDDMGDSASRPAASGARECAEASQAAWMKLGALNARRDVVVPTERTLAVLDYASRQTLEAGYPIFAWFIENAARRAINTGRVREYVLPLYEACLRGAELALHAGARAGGHGARKVAFAGVPGSKLDAASVIIPGMRDEGLEFIAQWLRDEAPKELWIAEPYFTPRNVALLGLVREAAPDCRVLVVAGRKESLDGIAGDYDDAFRRAWAEAFTGDPPETSLIFAASRRTKKCPIHDRWWLGETGGLHLGTSYSGIGARVSAVTKMGLDETNATRRALAPYFGQVRVEFDGEKVEYLSLSL